MPPNRGFDAETELHHDTFAPHVPGRRLPEVWWQDAQGEHRVVISDKRILGSAPGSDLVLPDAATSRLHAELTLRDDGLWVRDLGSKNGTFIEGIRVGEARIPDGASLRIGGVSLRISYAGPTQAVELWPTERFGPLLGRSVPMRELFARLARLAAAEGTVLIGGETGVGKELVAEALHQQGPRAAGPFVVVDCAALAENLLEAELFGHARGAFTGAATAREGAFEAAHRGTLFLDEVGELPISMQPKLLRALEARSIRRLGETHYRPVDVRVVAATHRDLAAMVGQGAFREDLYFRLAVLPVRVPPLRERLDDLPILAEAFAAKSGGATLPPSLLHEMQTRSWFGNVRELRNFVERALALGAREALAMGEHAGTGMGAAATLPSVSLDEPFKVLRDRWLDHLERTYIGGLLERHEGNIAAVAQAAGLDRTYIYRIVRRHELSGRPGR